MDMQEERRHLITKVFPALRLYCEEREVSLFELDLRWGISEEEAKQGKVFDICLKEVQKTRPFFIGLLGERYGWIPTEAECKAMAENTAIFEDFPWIAGELAKGTSITEIEIQEGVLRSKEKMNAFFYFRSKKMETPPEFIEKNGSHEANMLMALKKTLMGQNIYPVKEYDSLEHLGTLVENDFKALVNGLFPQTSLSQLEKERMEQRNFLKGLTRVYVPNPEWYEKLDKFADSNEFEIMITGESKIGKSALIANWMVRRLERKKNEKIIYHFIEASKSGCNAHKIIQRLINEVRDIYNIPFNEEDASVFEPYESGNKNKSDKRNKELEELLFSHTEIGKLIIILDGIDLLLHISRENLPEYLPVFPENVKVVYSRSDIWQTSSTWDVFRELNIGVQSKESRKQIVKDYLKSFSKSLTPSQEERLGEDKKCENPLVLLSVLDELRVFGVHEKLDDQINYYLAAPDKESLFILIIKHIEELFKDDKSPNNLVKDILSLLALSSRGLSETEILEISGATPLYWSQLLNGMAGQLVIVNGTVSFSNSMIRDAVYEYFLPDSESEKPYRERIVSYMETRDQVSFEKKCVELLYQLYKLEEWDKLYNFLLNYNVIKYIYEYIAKFQLRSYIEILWEKNNKRYTKENFFELDNIIDNKNELLFIYKYLCKSYWSTESFLSLKFALKYMELCEDIYGRNHRETADAYCYAAKAYTYSELADKNKALEYFEKSLAVRKEVLGKNHPDTIYIYGSIGDCYCWLDKDTEKRLEYFKVALAMTEEAMGENHPDTASYYASVGNIYLSDFNDPKQALEYYKRALAIREKDISKFNRKFNEFQYDVVYSLMGIGTCYHAIGDKEKALEYYKKALNASEKTFGKRHIGNVQAYDRIGDFYYVMGDKIKALEYYENALAIREDFLRKYHREIASSCNTIGACYCDLGNYEKAIEFFKNAVEIQTHLYNFHKKTDTALYYENTGKCYYNMRKFMEASGYFENALEICKFLGLEEEVYFINCIIDEIKNPPELSDEEFERIKFSGLETSEQFIDRIKIRQN